VSSEYGRMWRDFIKVSNRVIYYSVLATTQDESAIIYEGLEFGRVSYRDSWSEIECFWKERLSVVMAQATCFEKYVIT